MLVQPERMREYILEDKLLLIELIDRLLSQIINDTRQLPKGNSPFHCRQVPNISLTEYLKRIFIETTGIAKFSNCSNAIFVLALIYIDRVQEASENLVLNYYCVHRLLICTVMVAAKYAEDFFYKNEYYAKVGGISRIEINALEKELLTVINFHLHVSDSEFNTYLQKLSAYRDVNQNPNPNE